MAARVIDIYLVGDEVEIILDGQWVAGQVIQHDYPAVWVQTGDGGRWFVTNGRRIRKRGENEDEAAA